MKHEDHPMNAEEATDVLKDMQKRAREPQNLYGGGQVDPSSAHMTDREQWRYYQGQLRTLCVLESSCDATMGDTVRGYLRSHRSLLQEMIHHIELRMAAKRHGVDCPTDAQ